jgi:hypothetical protein
MDEQQYRTPANFQIHGINSNVPCHGDTNHMIEGNYG